MIGSCACDYGDSSAQRARPVRRNEEFLEPVVEVGWLGEIEEFGGVVHHEKNRALGLLHGQWRWENAEMDTVMTAAGSLIASEGGSIWG